MRKSIFLTKGAKVLFERYIESQTNEGGVLTRILGAARDSISPQEEDNFVPEENTLIFKLPARLPLSFH